MGFALSVMDVPLLLVLPVCVVHCLILFDEQEHAYVTKRCR